jgi:hypothetical protein
MPRNAVALMPSLPMWAKIARWRKLKSNVLR